jgi:Tfp pilus assembly protein PilV
MKVGLNQRSGSPRSRGGFSLIDALFAMVIAGFMFVALYAGMAFGFRLIKMARENTRATQIMLEKMETLRLYTWTQVTNTGFIPTNKFTVPYYALGGTNTSLLYTGQVIIAACPIGASYSDNMRKVTVQLEWSPIGGTNRTRTMSTYVTRNGLQNYVW